MLTTSDAALHRKARALIGHGIESTTLEREKVERPWLRAATYAGYNFRMSHLLAALGVEQMRRLDGAERRPAPRGRALPRRAGRLERLELPVIADGRTHVLADVHAAAARRGPQRAAPRSCAPSASAPRCTSTRPCISSPATRTPGVGPGGLARTEWVAEHIVTLPIDPGLERRRRGPRGRRAALGARRSEACLSARPPCSISATACAGCTACVRCSRRGSRWRGVIGHAGSEAGELARVARPRGLPVPSAAEPERPRDARLDPRHSAAASP